jgi:hypothetical protein
MGRRMERLLVEWMGEYKKKKQVIGPTPHNAIADG